VQVPATSEDLQAKFMKFMLPDSYSDITLNEADAVDSFVVDNFITGGEQGGVIYRNKLYFCLGFAENRNYIYCIDLTRKQMVSYIRLSEIGLDYEIEGAFIYNGHLGGIFNSGRHIVEFDFE
jgi:hypothetical protein